LISKHGQKAAAMIRWVASVSLEKSPQPS